MAFGSWLVQLTRYIAEESEGNLFHRLDFILLYMSPEKMSYTKKLDRQIPLSSLAVSG